MSRTRVFVLYLGLLLVLGTATWLVLRQSDISRPLVEGLMTRVLARERFTLDSAAVDLAQGVVVLRGFAIATAAKDAALTADRVEVGVDANPLGRLGAVRHVSLSGVVLDLDLSGPNPPDLASLLRSPEGAGEPDADAPFPIVQLRDTTLRLRLRADADPVVIEDVALDVAPETETDRLVGLSGELRLPGGAHATLAGHGDPVRRSLRVVAEVEDLALSPDTAAAFDAEVDALLREAGVRGAVPHATLWIEYHAGDEHPFAAGVQLEVANLDFALPQFPWPVAGARGRVTADTRSGGRVQFDVETANGESTLAARGSLEGVLDGAPLVVIAGEAHAVPVGPELGAALRGIRETRDVWQAFEPSGGTLDVALRLANTRPGGPVQPELDLDLHGVAARFVGFPNANGRRGPAFPHPLRDLSGRLRIRESDIVVDGLRGALADGEVRIAGAIELGSRGVPPNVRLDVHGDRVPFSPQVRAALAELSPEAIEVWDEYAPRGHAALDLSVRSGPGVAEEGVWLELRPTGASASFAGFPLRIDRIHGSVAIAPEGVSIELAGARGGAAVEIDGRFLEAAKDGGDGRLGTELWVRARDLALDRDLREALDTLSSDLGDVVDELGLEGRAHVEVALWRELDARGLSYDVRVDLRDAAGIVAELRLPIAGLTGPVYIHGDGDRTRVDVAAVRGTIANGPGVPPAEILVHGSVDIDSAAGGAGIDVTAVVRGLELTDDLALAMDQSGAFQLESWRLLAPSGFVDAIARLTRRPGSKQRLEQHLRLQLDGVSSAAEFLPAPAHDLRGEVVVVGGNATFADVRGRMADAEIHCSEGHVRSDDSVTEFRAVVSSESFPVDDRLANLLDGPMKATYLERQVRGRIKIDDLTVLCRFPEAGEGFESRLSGRFLAQGVDLELGTHVENVMGTWVLDEVHIAGNDAIVRGSVENGAATVYGHRVSGLGARFAGDPETVRFGAVSARFHGGAITGGDGSKDDLVYRMSGPGELQFDLSWRDVELAELLRGSGTARSEYRGNLSGSFRLEQLLGDDYVDARGHGEIAIDQGDLGTVPIFTAIYRHLQPQRRPRFDGARMKVTVRDRRVAIEDLTVTSSLATVTGEGTITMGGYIDMRLDFPDLFGDDANVFVIPQVLKALTSVVQFQIHGYLRSPRARPLWLWDSKPPREELGPIPAAPVDR